VIARRKCLSLFKITRIHTKLKLLADFAFDLWSSASLSLFKREPSLLKMSQRENPNQA